MQPASIDDLYEPKPADPATLGLYQRPLDENPTGMLGAAARKFGLGAAPAAAGLAAFEPGAAAGGAIGALGGPLAPFTAPAGALIGGLGAAFGASWLASKGQDKLIDHLDPVTQRTLGIDADTRAADDLYHPTAGFLGGVAAQAITLKPGLPGAGAGLLGAGVGAATEAGTEWAQDGEVHVGRVLAQAAAGAFLGHPNRLGAAVMTPGRVIAARIRTGTGRTAAELGAADTLADKPAGLPDAHRTPDEIAADTVTAQAAHADETNPFAPGPGRDAAHGARLAEASEAIVDGRAPDFSRLPPVAMIDVDGMIRRHVEQLEGGGEPVTDSGGFTRFGVSANANPDVDIAGLDEAKAVALLKRRYWLPMHLDGLDPDLAAVAFDAAMMHGPAKAKAMLAESGGSVERLIALRREAVAHLIAANPAKYGRYERGWENRFRKLEGWYGDHGEARAPEPPAETAQDGAEPEIDTSPELELSALPHGDEAIIARGDERAAIGDRLQSFATRSAADDSGAMERLPLGEVSGEQAGLVQDATGLDVGGFAHVADTGAIRHWWNTHGPDGSRIPPDGRAMTMDDLALVPHILADPDAVEPGRAATAKGRTATVVFRKRVGDEFFYVEEVRAKAGELAMKSFYVRKAPRGGDAEAPPRTSGPLAGDAGIADPRPAGNDAAEVAPAPAEDRRVGAGGRAASPGREADVAIGAPIEAAKPFDEPAGDGAAALGESVEHDLRRAIEADPAMTVQLNEDGAPTRVADVLKALDEEQSGVAALKACAAPPKGTA